MIETYLAVIAGLLGGLVFLALLFGGTYMAVLFDIRDLLGDLKEYARDEERDRRRAERDRDRAERRAAR